jgi:hypothetical protein
VTGGAIRGPMARVVPVAASGWLALTVVVTLIGFQPSVRRPTLDWAHALHGLFALGWSITLAGQAWLAEQRRRDAHRLVAVAGMVFGTGLVSTALPMLASLAAGARMRGDSNPRDAFAPTRFPGVRLKPLGHPSGKSNAPPRQATAARLCARCHNNTASGQGEIRTHDTVAGMPVFETGAFNHSATCPWCRRRPNAPGAIIAKRRMGSDQVPTAAVCAPAVICRRAHSPARYPARAPPSSTSGPAAGDPSRAFP